MPSRRPGLRSRPGRPFRPRLSRPAPRGGHFAAARATVRCPPRSRPAAAGAEAAGCGSSPPRIPAPAPILDLVRTRALGRTRSLARKAEKEFGFGLEAFAGRTIALATPEELALAKHLMTFGLTLEAVAADCRPNFLCNYLYELAGLLSRFWEGCPVLKAEEPQRSSRLLLNELTGRVLKQGLDALGIETTEVM